MSGNLAAAAAEVGLQLAPPGAAPSMVAAGGTLADPSRTLADPSGGRDAAEAGVIRPLDAGSLEALF